MELTLEEYAKLIEETIPDGPEDKEAKKQAFFEESNGETNENRK